MRKTIAVLISVVGFTTSANACWLCGALSLNASHSAPLGSQLMDSSSSLDTSPAGGPLTVPSYHSLSGAHAKIFLDFDGDYTANWSGYTPGTTPAYDTDGDASSFSSTELTNITEIWKRVSEKYSPFNIDVTTVDPGNENDLETTRVVIGGAGAWFGLSGGVAWPGSFYNGYPNKVFVFPVNLANGVPKYTAEASAHEAGHSFGLQHQSAYSGTDKTAEYSDGDGVNKAPTMGKSYHTTRGLWWNGPSTSGYNVIQDDLSILSSSTNGFGYRNDDVGSTRATGSTLTLDGAGNVSGNGIIEKTSDVDYFNFSTLGGSYVFNVNNFEFGGMLDASAWLYDANGTLMNSSTTVALSEVMSGFLNAGSYSLVVGSAGNYGDIGQYTLSGAIAGAIVPEPSTFCLVVIPAFLARRRSR